MHLQVNEGPFEPVEHCVQVNSGAATVDLLTLQAEGQHFYLHLACNAIRFI